MKIKSLKTLTLFLFLLFPSILPAQNKTIVGFNLTTNYDYYTTIKPEAGLIFEKQLTTHSGFETGINFRTYQWELYVLINNQSYYPLISEKYISIPLSYKYYTKIVNASLGITYDYYVGWSQKNSSIDVTNFTKTDNYYLGLLAKISKPIRLDQDLVIEPELKANILLIPSLIEYYGLGITVRFNLNKD